MTDSHVQTKGSAFTQRGIAGTRHLRSTDSVRCDACTCISLYQRLLPDSTFLQLHSFPEATRNDGGHPRWPPSLHSDRRNPAYPEHATRGCYELNG